MTRKDFSFGIEAEFMLAKSDDYTPLWYQDITFKQVYEIFEQISLDDIPNEGLKLESPHKQALPYVVEGYHVPDADFNPIDLLPKGIEIRTPIAKDPVACINYLKILFNRLQVALKNNALAAVPISHHPLATSFNGPQNKRRYDFWQWAMQAMMTYGPDINISVPDEVQALIDDDILHAKVNYYGPALAALSLNAPFFGGNLWKKDDAFVRSARTYNRSIIAPAIELHPEQNGRLEFKLFEMPAKIDDYYAFVLTWLALLLDRDLPGRASKQDRIYDLGIAATQGLTSKKLRDRASEFYAAAYMNLERWGFNSDGLRSLSHRLDTKTTPADEMILDFRSHSNIKQSMQKLVKSFEETTHIFENRFVNIPERQRFFA